MSNVIAIDEINRTRSRYDVETIKRMMPSGDHFELKALRLAEADGGVRSGIWSAETIGLLIDRHLPNDLNYKSVLLGINPVHEWVYDADPQWRMKCGVWDAKTPYAGEPDIAAHIRVIIDIDPVEKSRPSTAAEISDMLSNVDLIDMPLLRRVWTIQTGNGVHLCCERSDGCEWDEDTIAMLRIYLKSVQDSPRWDRRISQIDTGTPLGRTACERLPGSVNRKFVETTEGSSRVKLVQWYKDPTPLAKITKKPRDFSPAKGGALPDVGTDIIDFMDEICPGWLEQLDQMRESRSRRGKSTLPKMSRAKSASETEEKKYQARREAFRRYAAKRRPADSGDNGRTGAFVIGATGTRSFDLDVETVVDVLFNCGWNASCNPPWELHELRERVISAHKTSHFPIGGYLTEKGWPKSSATSSEPRAKKYTGGKIKGGPAAAPDHQREEESPPPPPAIDPMIAEFSLEDPPPVAPTIQQQKAEKPADRRLTNYSIVTPEDGGRPEIRPLQFLEILDDLLHITGGWPAVVMGELFTHEGEDLKFFRKADDFFGWLWSQGLTVHWANIDGSISQAQFFAGIKSLSQGKTDVQIYRDVMKLPHEPRIEGVYYCEGKIDPQPTGYFDELLSLFAPAAPEDHTLIRAMFLTAFWGGPPGKRPMFVVEGDDSVEGGRGSGKTTLAQTLIKLTGEAAVSCQLDQKSTDELATRLLSTEAKTARVILLDNIKDSRISSQKIEELLTAEMISGRKLYEGDGRRPNYFTWIMTVNSPSLSKDLAQRSVSIKLKHPQYSSGWEARRTELLTNYHREIVSQILWELSQPVDHQRGEELSSLFRWPDWISQVLLRAGGDPSAAIATILERRDGHDDDASAGAVYAEAIRERIAQAKSQHLSRVQPYLIRAKTIAMWLIESGCLGSSNLIKVIRDLRFLNVPGLRIVPGKTDNVVRYLWTPQESIPGAKPVKFEEEFGS